MSCSWRTASTRSAMRRPSRPYEATDSPPMCSKIERHVDADLVATRGGYGQKVSVELDFPNRSTVLLALRRQHVQGRPIPAPPPQVTAFEAPVTIGRRRG